MHHQAKLLCHGTTAVHEQWHHIQNTSFALHTLNIESAKAARDKSHTQISAVPSDWRTALKISGL